jgi:hypothetical protein
MKRTPVRIAVTALVAVLSVIGITQVGQAPAAVSARGGDGWCC